MLKMIVMLATTVGSAVGWWIGAKVGGIMTAFSLSMVGFGVGMWLGRRLARNLGI